MKLIFITLLILISLTGLYAQESILSTGGEGSGNGGFTSYSIGQVFYKTNIETNGSVAQGVQQPYEISTVLSVDDNYGVSIVMVAFPNPAIDFLTLKIENFNNEYLSYQLFDFLERLIDTKTITGNNTRIDMSKLPSATYLLRIKKDNKEIKEFRIIKY